MLASSEGALRHAFSNGITAFLFAATGSLAILITVGRGGGLAPADIASWIFGAYGLGGLLTLWMCWRYRQPLGMAWTIPGALLLPPALDHLSFAEVIGACWVTGILMAVLGASGVVNRVMSRVPMPIVMGMVAGVFLPFGLRVVTAFGELPAVAAITLGTFVLFTVLPALGRRVPPVLAALIAGVAATVLLGGMQPLGASAGLLAQPRLCAPAFSVQAMLELVVPMAVTVLAIQNAQGFAVLQQAGHAPPVRAVTVACGLGSLPFAAVGSVPTCLAGPVSGILVSSGARESHWLGGLVCGGAMVLFGLFAPAATRFALALPIALIGLLGGLAMLRVLQGAFQSAFRGRCPLGALVAFVVTVANVPILSIGAPFWGLVFAFVASALLEREDLRAAVQGQ
ncbi:MAG: benzoate/H(+) symporter BenE family transporter [Immundisolibacter sp.]|uniref:benzoate/H(+) symporter BenE family transporter n=1 Tax=Immundisolibacter sp. TaxID=1934948 RepID=UPI003D13E944